MGARLGARREMFARVKRAFRCPAVLQNFSVTGMEKAESSLGDGSHEDLEDRDPHNLNGHLQVGVDLLVEDV